MRFTPPSCSKDAVLARFLLASGSDAEMRGRLAEQGRPSDVVLNLTPLLHQGLRTPDSGLRPRPSLLMSWPQIDSHADSGTVFMLMQAIENMAPGCPACGRPVKGRTVAPCQCVVPCRCSPCKDGPNGRCDGSARGWVPSQARKWTWHSCCVRCEKKRCIHGEERYMVSSRHPGIIIPSRV